RADSVARSPSTQRRRSCGRGIESWTVSFIGLVRGLQAALRFYSGKVPVPAGEEDFETWIDQAVQAMEEWEVADTVKRQRLIERLRAPASDVIRNLKRDKPGCTAAEYLEALQEIFGGVEDCDELIHKFSHTYQKEGEELSTYVWRLDEIIHQVILKGGMEPSHASKALMDQIFKGALPLDPIMLKFQIRYQSKRLTYSKLVKAIREEEALIKAKRVANASHTVFTAEVGTLCVADIQTEVLALKTQMSQMIELITLLLAKDTRTEGVAVASNRGSPSKPQEENMPTLSRKKCFGCGEIGHFRAQCPKGRAEKKPVEELLKAVEKLKLGTRRSKTAPIFKSEMKGREGPDPCQMLCLPGLKELLP
uniref:CCHC-type domain-containing protein n=1 Tax=Leptobrachium leishanense TaxID=445787 RepID=A0A8C5QHI3_9ANUR